LSAVRGRKIGFVFQSYQLIPTLTALENVLLPFELNADGSGIQRARGLLEEMGLAERTDHYPVQLSGGEQQRVALARALVNQPRLLLADEPTGDLDETTAAKVFELIQRLHASHGLTSILVTHNLDLARRCSRVLKLEGGHLVEPAA
jgi:predicted ABC-type transport system involved in lysophospholipase L1 biosynthesis ATPase subunit